MNNQLSYTFWTTLGLLVICVVHDVTSASIPRRGQFMKNDVPRRHYDELIASRHIRNSYDDATSSEEMPAKQEYVLQIHVAPPSEVAVQKYGRLELFCDVSGSPPPTIHWMKNGKPIREAPFDVEESTNAILETDFTKPSIGLALTKSRLVIDCADESTEAIYSCVAESQSERVVSSTFVHIAGTAPYNKTACELVHGKHYLPAIIFMWSGTFIAEEGQDAVLMCRVAGNPRPRITWYDRDDKPIRTGIKYQILPTGDLKISHLRWKDDMGGYTCRAENRIGTSSDYQTTMDESVTFLYPVALEM